MYLIAELPQETNYCRHHVQKICAFFAAMEAFASALTNAGHHCLHLTLDDTADYLDLPQLLTHLLKRFEVEQFAYQAPDERRLAAQLDTFCRTSSINCQQVTTEHFLVEDPEDSQWHIKPGDKMENFYRKMRKRHGLLLDDQGKPVGGQWNFDQENRKKLKPADLDQIPEPLVFKNDVSAILDRIKRHRVEIIGEATNPLPWPINRKQARELLRFFCRQQLPNFGRFQDAMTDQSEHGWSLYHSRMSFALNAKILHPLEVINAALKSHAENPEAIPLAAIEGFVRQIMGWREYIRLIYWQHRQYDDENYFSAKRPLPAYFWTGNTHMNCLKNAIGQSLTFAYAHHIQRLMVTGNFCLLTGVHPDEVDDWYLGIYIDAIEWVEQPNTRGMSQFADGGLLATKPYAASGNYIKGMSDYCTGCTYRVNRTTEEDACPLNSLYWHFLNRHESLLSSNPRMGLMYKQWQKKSPEQQQALLKRADWCLDNIENL